MKKFLLIPLSFLFIALFSGNAQAQEGLNGYLGWGGTIKSDNFNEFSFTIRAGALKEMFGAEVLARGNKGFDRASLLGGLSFCPVSSIMITLHAGYGKAVIRSEAPSTSIDEGEAPLLSPDVKIDGLELGGCLTALFPLSPKSRMFVFGGYSFIPSDKIETPYSEITIGLGFSFRMEEFFH